MTFTFRIPKVTVTGVDSHKSLQNLIEIKNHENALLISDGIKVRPEVESTINTNLQSIGIKTIQYNDVGMAVGHTTVNEALEQAKKIDADLVVSIGGRYAMHVGRLVAMLLTNGGNILDYSDIEHIKEHPASFVAVATTSSSGAAISTCVCYTNENSGERICFADPKLLPEIAVLDPSMTPWLSPRDIANDGMISFGYAIEALGSKLATPVTDSCALEAITNLVRWLPRIYSNSNNLEYREHLMFAQQLVSMSSSNVFSNLICKIAGQIEAMTHIGMGHSVASLVPLVIERFESVIPDKMEKLAKAILRADETLEYGGNGSAAHLMRGVISRLDMPLKMSFLGLEEQHIDALVESLTESTLKTNAPMPKDKESIRELLMNAL